jgi:RND family efflux transporter MFP subunit
MPTHHALPLRPTAASKILAVAALALLMAACGGRRAGNSVQAAPVAALTVTTTKVRNEEVARKLQVTGSIYPWQEVIVGSEVGGYRVSAVLVDVGSVVKKDQVLVRLSSDLLQADLDSKRAALRSAEAAQVKSAAALRRGDSIAGSGLLSAADLDTLHADDIAAQARVETSRADLRTAELRAHYAAVTASDDGTVTSRTVSEGQIAQAGAEMLRLLRQNRVEWRAEVPEAELKNIAAGQSVALTAIDGTKVVGTVRAVSPTVQATNRTGLVYVDVSNGQVRPGMFARGEIDIGKGNALLLPVTSIVMQDGYSYVFVLGDDNLVARRRVEPAGIRGEYMEISTGVRADDTVAVKGAGFLKDGDTVRVAEQAGP